MFENQPKGLWTLALANTGERFGYYTMLAVFALFLGENFGFDAGTASEIYTWFLTAVYFLPLFGGMAADKWGYNKMVIIGILIMFLGYLFLAIPLGGGSVAIAAMGAALLLVSLGTGFFKGNLQVMVGDLYNDPKYAQHRDSGFSLFYMAINIGALFAPTAATTIMAWAQNDLGYSKADSYHFAFAVACVSVIVSILIYFLGKKTYQQVLVADKKKEDGKTEEVEEMSPAETKERIVCLGLVFAVVIFFWMAFHQNGSALTFFAKKYTVGEVSGITRIGFNIWSLALIAVSVYFLISSFQAKTIKNRFILGLSTLVLWGGADALYAQMDNPTSIMPSDFQQFNPFFVVALTPISMLIFATLAKKGKEPSAPCKIALGMLVAALGFGVITMGSFGLISPMDLGNSTQNILSPNWLISTYLTLTFAELLLSPMGISFVSKVAPPQYKGMMMGGWFVATAIGNYLSSIPSLLWDKIPLIANWGILIALCLISAVVMFALLKKLNAATQD